MKHQSPNKSRAHVTLRKIARSSGIEEEIRELLTLINAHDQLFSFITICRNLQKILDLLVNCTGISLTDYNIDNWPHLLQWVSDHETDLQWTEKKNVITNSKSQNITPKIKGVTSYGFYSLLFHKHENSQYEDHFYLLIGHLLLAQINLVTEKISRDIYENFQVTPEQKDIFADNTLPYSAELAIRKLGSNDFISVLTKIDPFLPPDQFVQKYCTGRRKTVIKTCKELYDVTTFIGVAYHKIRRRKRRQIEDSSDNDAAFTKGEPEICIRAERPSELGDKDDVYEDWGKQTQVWERVYSKDSCRKPLSLDVCPEELAADGEVYWSEYDCETTRKGLGMLITAARGQVRQIVMANQHFPWTYSILAISEITSLMTVCTDIFKSLKEKATWTDEEFLQAEIISLIHIMLWTGSSLSRAKSFSILKHKENHDEDLALVLPSPKADNPTKEWRIKALVPAYKQVIKAPPDKIRPREDYIHLPDIVKGSTFVCIYKERLGRSKKKTFPRHEKTYAKEIKAFFAANWESERFTIEKINKYLFHALLTYSHDITAACAITGNAHYLSQAKIFYSTINIDKLRDTYATVTGILGEYIYKASNRDSKSSTIDLPKLYTKKFIGSRLCSTITAVQDAIANLQRELKSTSSYSDRSGFIRHHNLYTLYTLMTISYATAFRAVTSPFLSSNEIDPKTGLTVIADKDGPDHHKSRLVWVPPEVAKQIQYYEAHIQSTEFFARMPLTQRKMVNNLPVCFFIDDGYRFMPVSPKTIIPHLSEFLPLPPNSHRRFMRMHLLEQGCPSEVVDSYMGHWSRGEEPWGKFSSFSFSDYVSYLNKHLLPLLKELGFKAIKSNLGKSL